jgi:hypothetical protein
MRRPPIGSASGVASNAAERVLGGIPTTTADKTTKARPESRYLSIYLNDHFAGSVMGVELARRISGHHEGTEAGRVLAAVRDEIEADQETLKRLIERLGFEQSRLKPAGAWVLERLGRLKLNGQLRGLSPLGRMVELEELGAGITGKMMLWRALERSLGQTVPGFDFAALAARAESQRERVEALRLDGATEAFPAGD